MIQDKFTAHEAMVARPFDAKAIGAVIVKPPAWTRLEPQSLSGEPAPGVEMRVADALWMMARQWQLGEFQGEDCGTPVSVRVSAQSQSLTALRPGDPQRAATAMPLPEGCAIEPQIEAEPWAAPSLRDRAEAGQALVQGLAPLGWAGEAQLLADCRFDLAAADIVAQQPDESWQLIAQHLPDAEAAALALEAGTPAWMEGEPAEISDAAQEWLDWYRSNVSHPRDSESWHSDRLEYRFGLQAGAGADARRIEAPCHLGGPVDWFSFELAEGTGLGIDADAPIREHHAHVHASHLRYPGMPAPRLWQFEDGLVNFGLTDVQPNDLARLAFLEYATIYGTDWLIAPIDLPRAALVGVTAVSYRTTFNEEIVVSAAADQPRKGRFSLYRTDGPDGAEPCFVIPPNARPALEGAAREEVVFARDETANVVWAIERSHEGADGLARDRSPEADTRATLPARPRAGAQDAWTLEVLPPAHWIPMVPIPTSRFGGFVLRKGSFDGTDTARGRVLSPRPYDLQDEEVPREGVRLRRVPSVLRDEQGMLHRWVARRITTAWGEASSRLEYDATRGAE
ncbi:hypothetical protein [Paracoccus laeviglucosivorans]|uniref:Uncharacterized protein n=1 Tax=Paracoccus laeviglucosivorans TaxID=1197861 RepID=A0A521DZF4_9RHOB|nr:hypothetical protein [Paracoccus laeviglucosivorans]SMO77076.1 hypothetical protein SAMN06265221_110117 [Paracoccus laeviglucosivorans]